MNSSQSSLLNLTNLAVVGDFNGVRIGTNTGASTPSGLVPNKSLTEFEQGNGSNSSSNSSKSGNIGLESNGQEEKRTGMQDQQAEGDIRTRSRESDDFLGSKGVPALLPHLNYQNGDGNNSTNVSGGKKMNPTSRSSMQGAQSNGDLGQREGYMPFPHRSSSSVSLQRMHMTSGIDIPLVPGSPQLTGGSNTPLGQSIMTGYKSSQLGNHSQIEGSRFNGITGMTPLNTPGSNELGGGDSQGPPSSSANRVNTSSFSQIRMGTGMNAGGHMVTGNSSSNHLMGVQMPVMLNNGSDSGNNVTNASQRMMNMKSDFTDMPLPPQLTNSMINTNGNTTHPGTPGSLLQNPTSTSITASSLPTLNIIRNETDPVDTEVKLIGKSGKPLRNTKRAAQNRSAQRAFRQRREKYIKDLEYKARDYDRLVSELEGCKNEILTLKSQLANIHQRSSL